MGNIETKTRHSAPMQTPNRNMTNDSLNEDEIEAIKAAASVISNIVVIAVGCFTIKWYLKKIGELMNPGYDKDMEKRHKPLLEHIKKNHAMGKKVQELYFNAYEKQLLGSLVLPHEIDVCFDDVGGLDDEKKELYDVVIAPLKYPGLYRKHPLVGQPKGVLLYGPPGTGKTLLAKAIATNSGACFLNVQHSTIMNKFVGESQKIVKAIFTLARKLSPCIIFLDEVESFMGNRQGNDHFVLSSTKSEFLSMWDGMVGSNSNDGGVLLIGATNRKNDIDPAFLRRMPRQFEIGLPSADERIHIMEVILSTHNAMLDETVDLNIIAHLTNGYSGSDLREVCRVAAHVPLQELLQQRRECIQNTMSPHPIIDVNSTTNYEPASISDDEVVDGEDMDPDTTRSITHKDFVVALEKVPPSTMPSIPGGDNDSGNVMKLNPAAIAQLLNSFYNSSHAQTQ